MAEITAAMVKQLRERTGAGMMDCKKALEEASGDYEQAIEVLRKKGLKDISKRDGKVAAEGVVGVYLHQGGQVAAIVELNCETDFVARGEDFNSLAKGIAMHVAAMAPEYVSEELVPESLKAKEEEIIVAQLTESQREKADMIVPGKLKKVLSEISLYSQPYIKDDSKTVLEAVQELSAKVGEKITVRRFSRFKVGEGIEKVAANFAEEVASAICGN